MMGLTATTEQEVTWQWARAEVSSPRFGHLYRDSLSPSIVAALDREDRGALSAADWAHLQVVVFGYVRRPLLSGLKRLGTTWYASRVSSADLSVLRIMDLPQFRDVSPSLRLLELVQVLERGDDLPRDPEFAPNYRALDAFDPAKLTAAPILVAMNVEGPYGILEGYSRLAVLLLRYMQGRALPDIPVLIGACARIREWRLHDQPGHVLLFWD